MKAHFRIVSRSQHFGHNGIMRTYVGVDYVESFDGRKWKKLQNKARAARRRERWQANG